MTPSPPLICFIHIEKAAGMTLHAIFRNNWPIGYLTLTPFHLWSNERGNELSPEELRALLRILPCTRGIGGHTIRSFLGYDEKIARPVKYMTWLREPIARYLSQYNYQCNVMKKGWNIESFLDEERFANFMTVRLAGEANLQKAKQELSDRFAFVGLTEEFDKSLLLMKQGLNLDDFDLRYEQENRSRNPNYSRDPKLEDERILERMRERNALDLQLYEYARSELFERQCSLYCGDLESDLRILAAQASGFTFPVHRRIIWNVYRQLVYRHIEGFFQRRFGPSWRAARMGAHVPDMHYRRL